MKHTLLSLRFIFLGLCFSFWHTVTSVTLWISEKSADQMESIMEEQDIVSGKMIDILRYR